MNHYFKLSFLLLVGLLPLSLSAFDFEVDGVYYNFDGDCAIVTYKCDWDSEDENPYLYKGEVCIPDCVTYNGITYPVTAIGDDAFSGCFELESVILPNSIKTIGNQAFSYCEYLSNVTIPNSVTTIGNYAFECCGRLSGVSIPNSVTSIGDGAFYACLMMSGIELPNSVVSLGASAFNYCLNLSSVTIPNSITEIKSGTFAYTKLDSVNIPNSVTNIGSGAFFNCQKLTSVTLPNTIIGIDEDAFSFSAITSITIPNSVSLIGDGAFSECSKLRDVYCYVPDPTLITIGTNVFYLCDSSGYDNRTLYVLDEYVQSYKNFARWNIFFNFNIIGIEGTSSSNYNGDVNGDGVVNILDLSDLIDLLLKAHN